MSLEKSERRDVHIVGITCLIGAIVLSILMGWGIVTFGWDMSVLVVVVTDGVMWVIGIGCLLKPDTFGRALREWAEHNGG